MSTVTGKVYLPVDRRSDQIVYYDRAVEENLAREREVLESRHLSVLKAKAQLVSGITVDEEIMGGDPVIAGTRIPVYGILAHFAEGYSIADLTTECYPTLTTQQVANALKFAALMTTLDTFEDIEPDEPPVS